jgi:hypothetical protein
MISFRISRGRIYSISEICPKTLGFNSLRVEARAPRQQYKLLNCSVLQSFQDVDGLGSVLEQSRRLLAYHA